MQPILYINIVSALTLLHVSYVVTADGSQAGDCTSGFMSRERMDILLHGVSSSKHIFRGGIAQGIFPGMNFTCNGSIQSIIFGAQWQGNSSSFPELQIWRPHGSQSFSKVRSTLINVTGENRSELYQYTLTSPLAFGKGDILGYYQPASQLGLYFEMDGRGQLGHLYTTSKVSNNLDVSDSTNFNNVQVLLNVVTDALGCEHGFMRELRMKVLLGLETATYDSISSTVSQLFLTPHMRFTCNGMITKWIIAANVNSYEPHTAELQLWRNTTYGVYERINKTLITMTKSSLAVYEFDNFSPIPFQAGDFLGLHLPFSEVITLYSEDTNSIINYYIDTAGNYDNTLSYKINTTLLASSYYHPMVSVEISACSYVSYSRSVISTDNYPLIITTKSARVSISSLMTHDSIATSSVQVVTTSPSPSNTISTSASSHLSSDPTLSLFTSELPSHPSHDGDTSTTPSSNKEHLSSVPTSSHSTTESPSHPYHDGDTSIRISIRIYGGTVAAVILLVLIIVAVLACVLQQRRSKKAVDMEQTNAYSQVYPAPVNNEKEVDVQHKEQTNEECVENPIYAVKNEKTVDVQHKEHTHKESVENPLYADVMHKEKTSQVYSGSNVYKTLPQVAQPPPSPESEHVYEIL